MKNKQRVVKIELIMRVFFIFLTLVAIIYKIFEFDGESAEGELLFGSFLTLILFLLPSFFSKRTKIRIPPVFQIFLLLFIFASMYLGEIQRFFDKFSWWDTMLHSFSAMMLAYIGFLLIFTLNRDENMHLKLSPFFIALFSFCFAIMIGTLWEIFEYLGDGLFNTNMQKARNLCINGLMDSRLGVIDTMKDLIVDAIGAFIVAIIGYYYCKKKMVIDNTFWRLKEQFVGDNPGIFKKK